MELGGRVQKKHYFHQARSAIEGKKREGRGGSFSFTPQDSGVNPLKSLLITELNTIFTMLNCLGAFNRIKPVFSLLKFFARLFEFSTKRF